MSRPPQANAAHGRDGRLLATLQQLLGIRAVGLAEALDEASRLIGEALGAEKVDAFLHEPADDTLAAVGTSGTPLAARQRALGLDRLPLAAGGWPAAVFRTGRPYRTGRAAGDRTAPADFAAALGVRSVIAVPLEVGAARRGVLAAASTRPGRFSAADLRFLEAAARWLGVIVERTELQQRLTAAQVAEARRAAVEELLTRQAFHDPLTGLPNRALLLDRLGHAAARLARHEGTLAVLFLDLDRFKAVNDRWGHAAGDRLLVAVADRLRACVRPQDTVARLGGDEFVLLLEAVPDAGEAQRVAERVLRALAPPFALDARWVALGGSIGIALGRGGAASPEELLGAADAALYQAKRGGGGRQVLYDPALHAAAAARLAWEEELRRAIEREELRLVYQPQVDLASGRIARLEALVRWSHPERGLVLPGAFIGLAEETGLIVPLGRWVRREALRQGRAWRARHPADALPGIATNLSVRELRQPELAAEIGAVVTAVGPAAGGVQLELTESVLLEDVAGAAATLHRLKGLGVALALDDFGTGYSSLRYLKRLPFDALKIDRTFVAGLGREPEDTAIVRAAVALGQALGLAVHAEGVETAAQAAQLRALGCTLGQGYLYAPPLPPDQIPALLARQAAGGAWRGAEAG